MSDIKEEEKTPLLGNKGENSENTEVYTRRWYIIVVFCLGSFTQAAVWNTWGPITESSEAVFGWEDSNIGMFANYGNIAFMVTVFPMCYFMDVKGLRISMLICSFLVMAGAGVRCISFEPKYQTWLSNLCAILVGIGGSVPFAGPAKVSSVWFPPDQRTTATSIVSFANYFGVGMAFIIGPQFVESPKYGHINSTSTPNSSFEMLTSNYMEKNNITHEVLINKDILRTDIQHLMYLHAGLGGLFFLMTLLYFPAKPPKPPSQTASLERVEWMKGLKTLASNGSFWLVVLAGSISTGVLGVWSSVLDVNLKPHGISQDHAGYMGFWQTLAGCVSGLAIGRFSDIFMKRMKMFLILLFIGAILSTAWFTVLVLQYIPFNMPSLYASCILIGVFINGGIPLFYEISCEASYPVAEGITGGVMTFLNNLVGICFLFIMLIKNIGTSWMNWALLGSTIVALPLLFVFPERYRRTDLDLTIDVKVAAGDLQASDTTHSSTEKV